MLDLLNGVKRKNRQMIQGVFLHQVAFLPAHQVIEIFLIIFCIF